MTNETTGRVCFIIPPSVFLLDERVFMTLGVLKVAAVVEKLTPVDVLDLSGVENYEEVVRDYVASADTEVFGITATTPQMPAVSRIVEVIRTTHPSGRVILGGPHGTLLHAARRLECKKGVMGRASRSFSELEEMFDVIVAGDGEIAIHQAIGHNLHRVIDADDPKTEFFLKDEQLDELPWPARHLVEVDSYHYSIEGKRALSLITQLGCPFNCGFCGGRNSPFLRRVRMRSIGNVLGEVEHLHRKYGVDGFMFYDDELNVNRAIVQMMHGLEEMQDRLGVEFQLRGFIKAQLFTDEQAEAMYNAGFRWILVGFESGSPRILWNINKRATREENSRCMEIAKRHGLKVKTLMSIGHPGESEETVMDTHRWLLEVEPEDFDVTIITVYPGSPYYDEAVSHPSLPGVWVYTYGGDNLYSVEVDYRLTAEYYKGDPNEGYQAFVYTDLLSSERIVELRDFVERDVRKRLGIPFNPSALALRYEHSMGQSGVLPAYILRKGGV